MKTFEPVKGFSFAPFVPAGRVNTDEAKKSLLAMKERTGSNFTKAFSALLLMIMVRHGRMIPRKERERNMTIWRKWRLQNMRRPATCNLLVFRTAQF